MWELCGRYLGEGGWERRVCLRSLGLLGDGPGVTGRETSESAEADSIGQVSFICSGI
jgi:hypothetical protein